MKQTLRRLGLGRLLLSSVLLAGCAPNISGVVSADRTGTLLDPLALRDDPTAAVRSLCGEAGPTGESIRRSPYLQASSEGGTRLSWTSSASAPETFAVWPAGDAEAETVLAVATEPTRYLAGATQRGVAVPGLEPGSVHCYELRDAAGSVVYGPSGFRTPPTDPEAPVRIVAFGDSGFGGSDQRAVFEQLLTVPTDLVLHVGDIAYESGTLDQLEGNYFDMYEGYLGSIPLFPSIGDHDDETDSAGPYREVFDLPTNGTGERWYSFDWGQVHVAVLDVLGDLGAQAAWLESDLAAAEARDQWRIVVASSPPYSSGFHGSYDDVRNAFEPVFVRHHVHLVLSGDDHDYERTVPIQGVTYVVTGGGGRSVRPVGASDWTAFSVMALHFTYLEIEGDLMRLHAIDATGREFDGVEIPRQPS